MEVLVEQFFVSATAALIFCANVKGDARKHNFATKWQILSDIIGSTGTLTGLFNGRLSVKIRNSDMTFSGRFWHENCIF